MSEEKTVVKENAQNKIGAKSDEEGYKIAKLIRLGSRELDRQLNVKKSRNTR